MKKPLKMGSEWLGWKWEKFCETGLNISSNTSAITPCFQQMHIMLPTFAWMSIFSAYHYGLLSSEVYRNRTQLICLNLRAFFVLGLAVTPVIQLLVTMNSVMIWPVDILLTCVQFLAWTVHFGESLKVFIDLRFLSVFFHRLDNIIQKIWRFESSRSVDSSRSLLRFTFALCFVVSNESR